MYEERGVKLPPMLFSWAAGSCSLSHWGKLCVTQLYTLSFSNRVNSSAQSYFWFGNWCWGWRWKGLSSLSVASSSADPDQVPICLGQYITPTKLCRKAIRVFGWFLEQYDLISVFFQTWQLHKGGGGGREAQTLGWGHVTLATSSLCHIWVQSRIDNGYF